MDAYMASSAPSLDGRSWPSIPTVAQEKDLREVSIACGDLEPASETHCDASLQQASTKKRGTRTPSLCGSCGNEKHTGNAQPNDVTTVLYEIVETDENHATSGGANKKSEKAPTYRFEKHFELRNLYETLHHDDVMAYGTTTLEDVRCYLLLALGYAMMVFGLVYFEPVQYWSGIQIDWMFWARGIGMVGSMLLISAILGHRVVTRGLKVGYARKICHFLIHSLPALFTVTLPSYELDSEASRFSVRDKVRVNDLVWQQALMIAYLALLIKPFRRGSKVLMCAHRAFDRPEDRPYTLSWILSQTIVISVFIAYMFIWLLTKEDKLSLTFLPIIVSNIGDGLAEPIGIRYGKHKYQTRALWYNGRLCSGSFTRSLEGSSAVFLTALLSVVGYYVLGFFTTPQFIFAVIAMPVGYTLTEAYAPHTWDNPLLVAVGFFMTWFTLDVVDPTK